MGILILSVTCSGNKRNTIQQMAAEMCQAMSLINEADTMSLVEAKSALTKIAQHKKKYRHVTQEELIKEMQVQCPDGAAKVLRFLEEE